MGNNTKGAENIETRNAFLFTAYFMLKRDKMNHNKKIKISIPLGKQ